MCAGISVCIKVWLTLSPADKEDDLINLETPPKLNSIELQTILSRGLARIEEKENSYHEFAGIKLNLNSLVKQAVDLTLWGKDLIDEAVKVSPEASLAWCGVSLVLPLLTRYAETKQVHRDGFYHVMARVKFYVQLQSILFSENQDQSINASEGTIVDLYQQILEFVFRTVLRFFRSSAKNWLRDFAQREDWTGMLQKIQDLENNLRDDLNKITNAVLVERLKEISNQTMESVGYSRGLLCAAEEQLLATKELVDIARKTLDLQKYSLEIDANATYGNAQDQDKPLCLEGTRKGVLSKISEWANDNNGETIFWLHGPAGTGKSTISRTAAANLDRTGQLGASYFFDFRNPARTKSNHLWPTIADKLATSFPGLERLVCDELDKLGNLGKTKMETRALKEQFHMLIQTPLERLSKHWSATWTRVIVIDALDECKDPKAVKTICNLLPKLQQFHKMGLRVLLISRTDGPINEVFGQSEKRDNIISLSLLHAGDESRTDVITFLNTKLSEIKYRRLKSLQEAWPSHNDMERLYTLATTPEPLFIYAATLCLFIDAEDSRPSDQLKAWLDSKSDDSHLNRTYTPILDRLLTKPKDSQGDGRVSIGIEAMSQLKQILGAVVCLAAPLSPANLAKLLGTDEDDVDYWLQKLHPVLNIPTDPRAPVNILHKSFPDFLFGQGDTDADHNRFRLNAGEVHEMLALRCITRMRKKSKGLRNNFCGLSEYGKQVNEIDEAAIARVISPDLRYACLYWAHHLQNCKQRLQEMTLQRRISDLLEQFLAFLDWLIHLIQGKEYSIKEAPPKICDPLEEVESFLKQHFLHWLEALALMRHVPEGVVAMNELVALVKVSTVFT